MTQYVCLEAVEDNGVSSVYTISYCCPWDSDDKSILHMQRNCSAAELAVDAVNVLIDLAVAKGCAGIELRLCGELYEAVMPKCYNLDMKLPLSFRVIPDVTEYDRKLLDVCKRFALGNLSLYAEGTKDIA